MSSHHQSEFDRRDHQPFLDCLRQDSEETGPALCDLDVVKRDRFELLSAYLDGEVSPTERRLVSSWLTDDPDTQCLYRRLLCLRQGLSTLSQTPATESSEVLTRKVYQRLNQGVHRTCMASFAAVALAVFGVFSGTISNRLWGDGMQQAENALMGESAMAELGKQGPEPSPAVTVPSEARMETIVKQFQSQPSLTDSNSEL